MSRYEHGVITIRPYPNDKKAGWQVDLRIRKDGRTRRKRLKSPFEGKRETKRWAEHKHREFERELDADARGASDLLVADLVGPEIASAASRGLDPQSLERRRILLAKHVVPVIGDRRVATLGRSDIVDVLDSLDGLAPRSKQTVLAHLSAVLSYAVTMGHLRERPPFPRVKVARDDPEYYNHAELGRVVSAATRLGDQHLLMVLLGADAGLRCGEMWGLEWRDVDLRAKSMRVQRAVYDGVTKPTKGRRARTVGLTSRLMDVLEHQPTPLDLQTRVLACMVGMRSEERLRRMMREVTETAKLPERGGLHVLRHSFGSSLARAGVPIPQIRDLLGHADIKTTMRYIHTAPDERAAAIERLEAFRGTHVAPAKRPLENG